MVYYLKDQKFLQEICESQSKETFVRITILTQEELPVEQIEGIVTSGNININSKSAVQRTCSLSLIIKNKSVDDCLFYIKRKVKIEIGIRNNTDKYVEEEIIWFPMGLFLISSYSLAQNADGSLALNLIGKDKMCLLNGDMGGTINAETDFGSIDEYDEYGIKQNKKIPIKQILLDILHNYAHEKFSNIFLEDIEDYGLNLQVYRGNFPVYFFIQNNGDKLLPVNYTFKSDDRVYIKENGVFKERILKNLTKNELVRSDLMELEDISFPTEFYINQNDETGYYIKKIEYGDYIGNTLTELIYPDELIAKIGDSIVTILDKIKNILGNFEYFYDLEGKFVFRKQRNWKTVKNFSYQNDNNSLITDFNSDIDFVFTDLELITNLNFTPQIDQIKNDFTIWGNKPSLVGGEPVPIHLRYAIDTKPTQYTTIYIDNERFDIIKQYKTLFLPNSEESEEDWKNRLISEHPKITYYTKLPNGVNEGAQARCVDWREIIYQMAKDYRNFNQLDEFEVWLNQSNPLYINGKTGYEQYYIDLESFWRDIYQINNSNFNFFTDKLIKDIGYQTSLGEITYNITPLKENKDYSLEEIYWLEKIEEEDNGEYTPVIKKIGTLEDIITTNYNILQRFITKIALTEIMHKNPTLYKKIQALYKNMDYDNTLYFKDVNTVVAEINNKNIWVTPKKNDLLYHTFQEPYYRKSDTLDNNNLYSQVYTTYMSMANTINEIKNINEFFAINKKFNIEYFISQDSIPQPNKIYSLDNKGEELFDGISFTSGQDYYECDIDLNNCSTLFCPIENMDCEWFIKNASGYQLLGHYYPIDINENNWFTEPINKNNQTFKRLYTLKKTENIVYSNIGDDATNMQKLIAKFDEYDNNIINILHDILSNNKNLFTSKIDWNSDIWIQNNSLDNIFNIDEGDNAIDSLPDTQQALMLYRILNLKENNLLSFKPYGFENNQSYWNMDLLYHPEKLVFWLDFLDTDSSISNLSVKELGQKTKIINSKEVSAISYNDVLNNIFVEPEDKILNNEDKIKEYLSSGYNSKGYVYFNMGSNFMDYLTMGKSNIDAFTVLENQLYNFGYCGETVSFSCIPLYFLQPNINFQISNINNNEANIYTLSSITINLNTNNITMNINGNKIIENNISRKEIYENE